MDKTVCDNFIIGALKKKKKKKKKKKSSAIFMCKTITADSF